jgi:hypothetical protein
MSSTEHTAVARYHLENAWPKAARLALVALLFLGAIAVGLTVAGRSTPASTSSVTSGAPADGTAAGVGTESGSGGGGTGSGGGDSTDECDGNPGGEDPEPDPDPGFHGPDDLAPNPAPEPTPPDDLAPNPDPDPDAGGPNDVRAHPEPGTLKVHPQLRVGHAAGQGLRRRRVRLLRQSRRPCRQLDRQRRRRDQVQPTQRAIGRRSGDLPVDLDGLLGAGTG